MDYFTYWSVAYALPDLDATTVAGALVEQFFTCTSMLNDLHLDQSRNFESVVFQGCCHPLGIKKTKTTPVRP